MSRANGSILDKIRTEFRAPEGMPYKKAFNVATHEIISDMRDQSRTKDKDKMIQVLMESNDILRRDNQRLQRENEGLRQGHLPLAGGRTEALPEPDTEQDKGE